MSRLIATTADEMLLGTNSNVMGLYRGSDDEEPGQVVLGSTNMMPNPDLVDVNERGRLFGWDLSAPPDPDSWNVYMRKVQKYVSGSLQYIDKGPPMLRQNESKLRWKEHTYEQSHKLLTDKSLPDLGKDEPTDLAPPLDVPRIKVVTSAGGGGYPAKSAGALRASYFGILGDHPLGSRRITPAAPSVAMPAIAQGQNIVFYLPDEIPDSWTGVGFCVGDDDNNMRIQKRVDIRGKVLTQVVDRGPYRRDGTKVYPTGTTNAVNKTQMGSFNQLGKPKHWRDKSNRNLWAGQYPLAYQLKTKQGWTASSDIAYVHVDTEQKGEVIRWAPPDSALKKPGIIRWRPLFMSVDGKWRTFEDAKENGYGLSKSAAIHIRATGELWRSSNDPVKVGRSEKDSSGVAAPTDPMEPPIAQGREGMEPGKYAVRLTTANGKLDMESRPSPRATFTLTETSSGSGVTNQHVRIFRPPGQMIKNSRLVEVDPTNGTTELHWERVTTSGVTVADSILTIAATTGSTVYRRTDKEPIDPTKFYSLRWRVNFTAFSSGSLQMRLLFFQADGTTPASTASITVEDMAGIQDKHIKYALGPANGSANYDIPSNAAFVQAEIASAAGTTSFTVALSNIGMYVGRSHPRKLWDLVLAEDTPGKDVWPIADLETNADVVQMHYPPGAFIRTVTAPVSPAKHRAYTLLDTLGFETWNPPTTPANWAVPTVSTGTTFTVATDYALFGDYGAKLESTASSAANFTAYTWANFLSAGRTTFGLEAHLRVKALPSAGVVTLVGVTRAADNTSFLAYADLSSTGVLRLQFYNGTAMGTPITVSGVTVKAGDDLRIDFSFSNLKTAGTNGTVAMRVKRNDNAPVTVTSSSNSWSAIDANRVVVGYFAPTGGTGGTAAATSKVLLDRVRVMSTAVTETTDVPGNMVEYWAPEKQPAGDEDHFMTGVRFPVKPSTTYVDSFYLAHDGITTPADGAKFFKVVSFDADGEMVQDHGYIAEGIKGKSHWDRYWMSYTTPATAAYVEYTRNHVGDGLIWAMGFQHEVGSTPTTFINTNATSGTFNVIFKTTLDNGPKKDDLTFNKAILRARVVATQIYDANDVALTSTKFRMRQADTLSGLASAPWGADNVVTATPAHHYVEMEVTLTVLAGGGSSTISPEVRAVFLDVQRDRPVCLHQDGRDFQGGIIAYSLTPASPVPNVVRKEYADGSVGLENVGRGKPPERLKLSLQAHTAAGKRGAERTPATDTPHFVIETEDKRYQVAMLPEFTGNVEDEPDGRKYWDYVAEDVVADVMETEDL